MRMPPQIKTGNSIADLILGLLRPNDPAEAAMDMVAPIGMASNVGKKVLGKTLDLMPKLEMQKSAKARQGLDKVIQNMIGVRAKVPEDVLQALRMEQNLGFDTPNEAAGSIFRTGPNWSKNWEVVNTDLIPIIERWRKQLALETGIPSPRR